MTPFIQEAAESDILEQVAWYAEQGVPDIARRFYAATMDTIDALLTAPEAGAPRQTDNPRLAGLRSWTVKGFDELRIYYLLQAELLIVVRILHGKRDVAAILAEQDVIGPLEAAQDGATLQELTDSYNVSKATISRLKTHQAAAIAIAVRTSQGGQECRLL